MIHANLTASLLMAQLVFITGINADIEVFIQLFLTYLS